MSRIIFMAPFYLSDKLKSYILLRTLFFRIVTSVCKVNLLCFFQALAEALQEPLAQS
jgi:hypothetical protein